MICNIPLYFSICEHKINNVYNYYYYSNYYSRRYKKKGCFNLLFLFIILFIIYITCNNNTTKYNNIFIIGHIFYLFNDVIMYAP